MQYVVQVSCTVMVYFINLFWKWYNLIFVSLFDFNMPCSITEKATVIETLKVNGPKLTICEVSGV